MDQQNYAATRPVSADPEVALAKALGQWPKSSPAKSTLNGKTSVEELASELGLKLADQNQLTIPPHQARPGLFLRPAPTARRSVTPEPSAGCTGWQCLPPIARCATRPIPLRICRRFGVDAAGRLQYRYHADWEKVREHRKAHRLARLVAALPKIRRNVSAHLAGDEPTREFALSAVIELIARTAIRPGNESYARLNGTRGATTLLKSNVTLEDDSLVLTFKAKGGKAVRKECNAAKLVRAIGILRTVPGKRMFQYHDRSGVVRAASTTAVNAFLREIAGIKISLKDFRTLMASAVVVEIAVADHAGRKRTRPQAPGAGSDPRRRRQALQHAGDLPQELCPRHHRHGVRGRHTRAFRRHHGRLPLPIEARATAGAGGDGGCRGIAVAARRGRRFVFQRANSASRGAILAPSFRGANAMSEPGISRFRIVASRRPE